jgi:D-3-phosphoglycerate dehydrogenase
MILKKCRLLVTPTSYGRYDPLLKKELENQAGEVIYNPTGKPLSSEEVITLINGVDGYIAGLDEIDRQVLESADRLKIIARYGVGVDKVDLETAQEKGIIVTNTPGANSVSVAELTIGFILNLARNIPIAMNSVRNGEWPRLPGYSLYGKIIGILGFGAIGKELAKRLSCFGCKIIAHDPFINKEIALSLGAELVNLEELTRKSDFLSIHVPLTEKTREIINNEFISQMKKGAFLINTSRGGVINEGDLIKALCSGHLKGAALDAFMIEPPDPKNPLLSMPQVISTPHIGAQTDGAASNMGWTAMRDCLAVLKGEEPSYRVV